METVGRHAEQRVLYAWLASPDPPVLLVEGEAGIGKSTLWRAGVVEARRLGYRVLACAAAETETKLAFTALRDLLGEDFDDVAGELPAPQRAALAVTLLLEEPEGPPPEPGHIAVAFLGALSELAGRGRALLAIDDVQWVDEASASALSYLLRRIDSSSVAVLLAQRADAARARPLGLAAPGDDRVATLELGPLTIGALGRVLHDRLGTAYPRPTLHRLHQATGGNPFFALELARAIEARGEPLRPADPLPVPGTQRELVRRRLDALPPDTRSALAFATALSRPTLGLVTAALGADAHAALAEAERADVARIDGESVRFTHPLFAAATYELGASERSAVHERLAAVVADPEERARHLALAETEPDEEVARAIEDGARVAFARGSPEAAGELMEAALRLTPQESTAERSRRASDSGWHYFTAGDSARARALLGVAIESAAPGNDRARASFRLASVDHHSRDRRAALAEVERITRDEQVDDPEIKAEAHIVAAVSYWVLAEDIPQAQAHARTAVELSETLGDPSHLVSSLAVLGMTEFTLGGGLPSPTLERALGIEAEADDHRVLRRPLQHWAAMLLSADRYDEARPYFQEVHDLGVARGDASVLPWPLMRLAHLELLAGNWAQAAAHAEAGLDAARQTGQRPLEADLLCTRALVLAHVGRLDDARAAADEGLPLAERCGAGIGVRVAHWGLGLADVAVGDLPSAHARLAQLRASSAAAGVVDPGENRHLGDLGEVLAALGCVEEADDLASELDALGRSLDRPAAVAVASRIRGLAALESEQLDVAEEHLQRALEAHAVAPIPFERGRTLLALGSVQRRLRRRRAARETLEGAGAMFEALGAGLWAEKAHTELGRIPGRIPAPDGLTPAERRVAELVAEGRSNKEVAAELVITVHTVEAALTSIYRKLDVHSRTEMARKLSATDSR